MFQLDSKEIKSLTPDDIQKAKVFGKTIMILFEGKNINQDHSPLLEQFVEHKRIPVYRSGFQSPFQISIANDFDIKRTASQQLWILDYREGGSNPRRLKYPQSIITKQGVVEFIKSIEKEVNPKLFTHNTKSNFVTTFTELGFQHEIKRVTTETVILFFKDRCNFCNVMQQQFYEVAKNMSQYKTLVFGQVNLSKFSIIENKGNEECQTEECTKAINDIFSAPFIKFYPADHKDGILFEQSIELLPEFINNYRRLYESYLK